MFVLITYDVNTETAAGKKRLQQVAKQCENYGQRVQDSVFECVVEPAQLVVLKSKLEKIIDEEKDSIRYYSLGDEWRNRVDHMGVKKGIDLEAPLVL